MPLTAKHGSTLKQMAYAKRLFGAQGKSKRQIALDVGYSPWSANSTKSHIEDKAGFNNAMALLAADSNNLALEVMSQFKARGFDDFSNKDLIGALNAISSAWAKFNTGPKEREEKQSTNRLRTIILNQFENATILDTQKVTDVGEKKVDEDETVIDMQEYTEEEDAEAKEREELGF